MKKTTLRQAALKLAIVAIALFAPLGLRAQETLTVNDGTATNEYVPIYGLYVDTHGQNSEFIIPAETQGMSDMEGGTISKLAFYITNSPASWGSPTVQVYMGEVEGTTLSSLNGPTNFTPVWTGTLSNQSDTMEITLSDPYTYEGGNLLIGMYVQTASNTWKTTSFSGIIALSGSSRSNNGSGPGTAKSFLPKTTFTYEPASQGGCDKPETVTPSQITPNTAMLNWQGGSTPGNGYNVEIKGGQYAEWTRYASNISQGCLLNHLIENTAYQARVQVVCSTTDSSTWKSTSFTTPAYFSNFNVEIIQGEGNKAVFSWTENGFTPSDWQLCINGDENNLISMTSNPFTYNGLTPEVATTAKMRAFVGDNTGAWSNTVTFTPTNSYFITVNDSTATNGYVPIYGYYVDNITKSQFIIPANALADMVYGTINKMTFYAEADKNWGNAQFEVYMTETNETTISALADYGTMEKVKNAGSLSISGNKMVVEFDAPYQYMGGNLMIGFLQTATGTYSSCNWYGITATGASMGGHGTSIFQQNFLPKTKFEYLPGEAPACFKPTGLSVNYTGGTTAEVSWTSDAALFNIDVNGTVTEGVNNPYTIENLDLATNYEVKVQAVCDGTPSDWTNAASFTTDLCMPENQCQLSYELNLTNQYYNGWSYGASINVVDVATSSVIATLTSSGSSANGTVNVCDGREIRFEWNNGTYYNNYCTYTITDVNDEVVLSGSGSFSTPVTHTVSCTLTDCRKPSNLTATGTTAHSTQLSWTENGVGEEAVTSWVLAYKAPTDEDFTEVTVNTNENYSLNNLAQSTTYTWKVRSEGCEDKWSNTTTFTTNSGHVTPTGLAVANDNITSSKATATWNTVEGNTLHEYYELYYGTETTAPTSETEATISNITDLSKQITGLTPGTQYRLYVRDFCGAVEDGGDGYSNWSSAVTFTTKVGNAAPTNFTYDASTLTQTSVTLNWTGVATNDNHASYELYRSNENVAPTAESVPTVDGLTAATHTFTDLTAETEYFVWVRDNCGIDGPSGWTALTGNSFTTPTNCQTPDGLAAADADVTAHTATISWNTFGQTAFNLQYKKSTDEEWTLVEDPGTSYSMTGLDGETTYQVQVQTQCNTNEWSNTLEFTTLVACPAPTALAATLTPGNGTVATLKWNETGSATSWVLQYGTDQEFTAGTYTEVTEGFQTATVEETTTVSVDLTGLTAEQTLYAHVKAVCGGIDGESQYSSTYSFTPTNAYYVNNGNATTNGFAPLYGNYKSSYDQMIYTSAQLAAAGISGHVSITKIGFNSQSNNTIKRLPKIYIGITDKSSFSSSTDFISINNLTEVYSREYSNNTDDDDLWSITAGWNEFVLDEPFEYDGTSNLVIAMYCGIASNYANSNFYCVATTGSNQVVYAYSDSADPNPSTNDNSWSSYSGNKSTMSNLPVLRMFATPVSCSKPTALTVGEPTTNNVELSWTSTASAWQVCLNGDEDNLINITENPYTLTGLTPATEYTIKVRANCGDEDGVSDWSNPVSFTTEASCTEPSAFAIVENSIQAHQVQLRWTAGGDETAWDIYYSTENTAPVNGVTEPTNEAITANPYTLNGLDATTTYYVWVRAHCGDAAGQQSPWVGPVTFTTECEAISTFPWSENFESYDAGIFSDPCWVNEHISGDGTQIFKVYTSTNGSNSTHQLQLPDMYSGTMTKLQLPLMTLPNANYQFTIDVYRSASGTSYTSEGVRVFASSTGEIEGATELGFLYRNYTQSDGGVVVAENASGWYTYEFPIPFSGTCYIILRGENQYGTSTYMDNLTVEEIPSCARPTDLVKSDVTNHSATLTWTAGDENQHNWQVAYSKTSFDPNTASFDINTVETIDFTTSTTCTYRMDRRFDAASTYYLYIRANCGTATEPDYGPWSRNGISLTTSAAAPAPSAFTASNIASTKVDLVWNAGGGDYELSWDLYYVQSDDAPTAPTEETPATKTVTTLPTTENPYTLDDLTEELRYYIWVRANHTINSVTTHSAWVALTGNYFTTLAACSAQDPVVSNITHQNATVTWDGESQDGFTVKYRTSAGVSNNSLFSEDFEDETTFADWTFTSMNTANDIASGKAGRLADAKHNGDYGFRFSSFSTKTEGTYDQYLVSPELNVTGVLNFFYKKYNNNTETLQVGYSTTTDDYATAFTWIDLDLTTSWQQSEDITLPDNVKYIAFHYYANCQYYVYLDDINIWEPTHASAWQTKAATDNTATITSLTAETKYDVKVVPDCDETQESTIVTFTTKAAFPMHIDANKWYAISSPVHNDGNNQTLAGINNIDNSAYDLYGYNEANGTWVKEETSLIRGKGYIYRSAANTTLEFVGDYNTGNVSASNISVSNPDADLKGFALVGNPYNHEIYKGVAFGTSSYYYVTGWYSLQPNGCWYTHTNNEPIAAGEAALVKVNYSATLSFTDNANAPTSSKAAPAATLAFMVSNGDYKDIAYAMLSYGEGLPKVGHLSPEAPALSIPVAEKKYAIAMVGDDAESFDMVFRGTGTYTLSFNGNTGYCHLIDRVAGKDIDMLRQNYTFSSNGNDADRFTVKLSPEAQENAGSNFAYWNGNVWMVEGNGTLQVFDALGRQLLSQEISNSNFEIQNSLFPAAGVYVLRMGEKTQKIVVR